MLAQQRAAPTAAAWPFVRPDVRLVVSTTISLSLFLYSWKTSFSHFVLPLSGEPIPALLRDCKNPWRVRDKSNIVSNTSSRPPPLADDFIDPNIRGAKVCSPPRIPAPRRPTQFQISPRQTAVNCQFDKLITSLPMQTLIPNPKH